MSLAAENTVKPAIIVISSHVIRGSVGNRAAVFALEAFGFRVWVVPTVTLPWHPGHGPATQLVHDDTQFHSAIEDLTSAHWLSEVGAVLTGYMANASQVSSIAYLIECVRAKNPDLVYLCDPVIGDADTLYVPEDIAVSIRDLLLPMGDISTPNRFELSWLTGKTTLRSMEDTLAAAKSLGPETVLVTSAIDFEPGTTGSILAANGEDLVCKHPSVQNAPNGPGDLMSGLFLAHHMRCENNRAAFRFAMSAVYQMVLKSKARGSDELTLAQDAACLLKPGDQLKVSRL